MPEVSDLTQEGAAEGGANDWGEVVTRHPYENVGMDHLLSKEKVSDAHTRYVTLDGIGKRLK